MDQIINEQMLTWVIIPLLIFIARILDVSIGTLRLIFISRGYKWLAPVLGFFEVLIWLVAIRQILQHLDNWMCFIAYGLGFATGNYIGMFISQKLSLGKVILRVFLKDESTPLAKELRDGGYGITEVTGEGKSGPVKIVFSTMKKKDLPKALDVIHKYGKNIFYSVEEIASSGDGYFRKPIRRSFIPVISPYAFFRKGK